MNITTRQSMSLVPTKGLPRYGYNDEYEPGRYYVFRKKENATEPADNARALRAHKIGKTPLLSVHRKPRLAFLPGDEGSSTSGDS